VCCELDAERNVEEWKNGRRITNPKMVGENERGKDPFVVWMDGQEGKRN